MRNKLEARIIASFLRPSLCSGLEGLRNNVINVTHDMKTDVRCRRRRRRRLL
jgi:hypothetical protein